LKAIRNALDRAKPLFERGGRFERLYPLHEATEAFFFSTSATTTGSVHVRDAWDLKRMMVMVVVALIPCTLMGIYNAGYQVLLARGEATPFVACLLLGAGKVVPIILVSYVVGGAWEVLFACVRKHEINEGFLVTGLLFPLTLPPSIPLWIVAVGISFGVVIGKEIFGGTGMNVLNPALTARALVFFAYPGAISGDKVWTAVNQAKDRLIDGYSGATPLSVAAAADRGSQAVDAIQHAGYHYWQAFYGFLPGSIGETSTLACLIGAAILLGAGVASWRTMAACVIGMVATSALVAGLASPTSPAMFTIPPHWHLVLGGFAFGTVFMATDPVSCAATNTGKWVYGILIGALCATIRTINPAYPEGMMLAILFMNVFAPLIDYCVLQKYMKRRLSRAQ
jgi:Na+-transporting NADH:ubiquinone oxidoreductase subunit B